MHTLDRVAVVLRRVIAGCLVVMAIVAVLPGSHAGESSTARSVAGPRVLGVALEPLGENRATVQVRLSRPLPQAAVASVSLAPADRRWACTQPVPGEAVLRCPVAAVAAVDAGGTRIEVHI